MPPVFGPLIAVADALVVAGDANGAKALPVRQREQRELGTVQPLLHHHPGARGAERAIDHHLLDCVGSLVGRAADDDAFAKGGSVGLDHDFSRHALHVGQRRVDVVERGVGRSRHAEARDHVTRERLAAFNLSRAPRGSEDRNSDVLQLVRDPIDQRILGADDHHVWTLRPRPTDEIANVPRIDVERAGDIGCSRVARRAVDLRQRPVLPQPPANRVLASAAPHDQELGVRALRIYSHSMVPGGLEVMS